MDKRFPWIFEHGDRVKVKFEDKWEYGIALEQKSDMGVSHVLIRFDQGGVFWKNSEKVFHVRPGHPDPETGKDQEPAAAAPGDVCEMERCTRKATHVEITPHEDGRLMKCCPQHRSHLEKYGNLAVIGYEWMGYDVSRDKTFRKCRKCGSYIQDPKADPWKETRTEKGPMISRCWNCGEDHYGDDFRKWDIQVTYISIDHCRITRRFKTLEGARKFAAKYVGETPEIGFGYAVSGDGVGKVVTGGVSFNELFPKCFPPDPTRIITLRYPWEDDFPSPNDFRFRGIL